MRQHESENRLKICKQNFLTALKAFYAFTQKQIGSLSKDSVPVTFISLN